MQDAIRKLLDDPAFGDYEALSKKATFNAFDVLRYSDYEIRHSNVLAWLLRPDGTHGLGDAFLKRFVQCLNPKKQDRAKALPESCFDPKKVRVERELDDVDVMVFFEAKPRFLVVLENKPCACSPEHWRQLKRYMCEQREKRGDTYEIRGVLLTASAEAKCECRDCVHLSWWEVRELVRGFVEDRRFSAGDTTSFVRQYVEIVERNVLGLGPSAKCFQILLRSHRKALGSLLDCCTNSVTVRPAWGVPDGKVRAVERLLNEFRRQPFELRAAVRQLVVRAGYETELRGAPGGTAYWLSFWDDKWYSRAEALGLGDQGWWFEFTHRSVTVKLGGGAVSGKARKDAKAVMDLMRRVPVEGTDPRRLKFEGDYPYFYRRDLLTDAELADAPPEEVEARTLDRVKCFLESPDSDYKKIERYFEVLAFRPPPR